MLETDRDTRELMQAEGRFGGEERKQLVVGKIPGLYMFIPSENSML
jgi:hypothetical protein